VVDVFISHSNARPEITEVFYQALKGAGLIPVIVEEQPSKSMGPDEKVQHYLEQCQAAVVLATSDPDAPKRTRPNILEELGRIRTLLPDRFMVFVQAGVQMPSNVGVTWHELDPAHLRDAVDMMLKEFQEMGLHRAAPEARGVRMYEDLFPPDKLGAWDWAREVVRHALEDDEEIARLKTACMEVLLSPYYEEQHVAGMVLETLVEWRPLILAEEELRQLAVAESFTTRSTAASCMYQLAQCAPARVPLELLDTLADPSEDYYVQEPAMAALKYCARTRRPIGNCPWAGGSEVSGTAWGTEEKGRLPSLLTMLAWPSTTCWLGWPGKSYLRSSRGRLKPDAADMASQRALQGGACPCREKRRGRVSCPSSHPGRLR